MVLVVGPVGVTWKVPFDGFGWIVNQNEPSNMEPISVLKSKMAQTLSPAHPLITALTQTSVGNAKIVKLTESLLVFVHGESLKLQS